MNGIAPSPPAPVARAADGPDPRLAALALIPHGAFVLTAAHGETRGGILARWVQQVSSNPPLVVVAIEKGQPLSPIIRDARRFALCQLAPDDRVLRRMFEADRPDATDLFLGIPTMTAPGGAPVPLKAMCWLDCELTRHLDVEGNCELYIGLVESGGVLHPSAAHDGVASSHVPGRHESNSGSAHGTGNGSNGNGHHTNGHAAGSNGHRGHGDRGSSTQRGGRRGR
jgi:flavin reductase (DIM6/NTAB) family NADH-FMN oxidoreductase RutF